MTASYEKEKSIHDKNGAQIREQSEAFFYGSRISHNVDLFIPFYDDDEKDYDGRVGFQLSRSVGDDLEPLFLQPRLPDDCKGLAVSPSNARLLAYILLGYADAQECREIEYHNKKYGKNEP